MEDRAWNWKSENHQFSPTRAGQQPGYIGSYACDNLTMVLHCIYYSKSFEHGMLKIINLRGDADSTAAVLG
jgi:ADP-ribosylglycohydrolase